MKILQILQCAKTSLQHIFPACSLSILTNNEARNVAGVVRLLRRSFLSDAYACDAEWRQRLDNDAIRNVKVEEYHGSVVRELERRNRASALDLDLLTNAVTRRDELDLAEEAVYRFRHSYNNWEMLESTQYALLRAFLQHNHLDAILDVLTHRVDYGVFPNYHIANLLMDHFLKQENYKGAVTVGGQLVLQEEVDNPISRHLILYSAYMYLTTADLDGEVDAGGEDVDKADDDDEEWVVRMEYYRHPHHDGHFDLNTRELAGRSLQLVAPLHPDQLVARSLQLVGHAVAGDAPGRAGAVELLRGVVGVNTGPGTQHTVCREALDRFVASLQSPATSDSDRESGEGDNTAVKLEFEALVSRLEERGPDGGVSERPLSELVSEYVGSGRLEVYERVDIEGAVRDMARWAAVREERLREQVHDYLKAETVRTHAEQRRALAEKEQYLTYFDDKMATSKTLPDLNTVIGLREKYKFRMDELYDTYEDLLREEGWMEEALKRQPMESYVEKK